MTIKFLFLFNILILFFNCAAQGTASGGPPDKEGPKLIFVQPPNGILEIKPDQNISLVFNELLDPVSIPASITLAEGYKLKVKGRRILISPDKIWLENQILHINISRKIRDYQNNIMAEPIHLVYSTGTHIPNSQISGNIEGYSIGKIIEVGLYNWPMHDSSFVIQKVEADINGFFKFGSLEYGQYTLVAIEADLTNFGQQIRRKNYAMLTSDFISLTVADSAQHVNMMLSKPLERLMITSVEMENQYFTNLIMNDQSEENFILDTLFTPGDSVKINMRKSNRLETYALPEYIFILPEITDTTGPTYEGSEISPEAFSLTFSEPIRMASEAVVTEQDTIDLSIHFKMKNSITAILPNLADTITIIKLLGDYIQDMHGNIMVDSVIKIPIERARGKDDTIVGGNILGTVQYIGREPLMVEARNIENDEVYTVKVKKQEFILENLPAGVYKLWAFESLHTKDPTTYFSGIWAPYNRAARFVLHPDSVDVRARWDVGGIVIDFE